MSHVVRLYGWTRAVNGLNPLRGREEGEEEDLRGPVAGAALSVPAGWLARCRSVSLSRECAELPV